MIKQCLKLRLLDLAHDLLESRKQRFYETLDFDNIIRINGLQGEMYDLILG